MSEVYRIYNPSRDYRTIQYANTPIINNIGEDVWTDLEQISSFPYKWDDQFKPICDCPFIMGSIPVFSLKIIDKLSLFLNPSNSQLIPITVDGKDFFIVNIINFKNQFLNEKHSDIIYFSNHNIMDISRYVFNKRDKIPAFFRLRQFINYTFVNQIIFDILNCGVSGLSMESCKMI